MYTHLFIQLGNLIIYLFMLMFIIFLIVSKSLFYVIISPIFVYAFIVYGTTVLGMLALIYNVFVYYILRFNQINTQLQSYQIPKVPNPDIIDT